MTRKVIESSHAVAKAVKLCKAQVCPMYPITPSTHIPERIAEYVANAQFDAAMIDVESEHSAASAVIGAAAMGSRTFTATSSQGLALMFEILPITSGMRLPTVMAVANRALSAPINIWCFTKDAEVLMDDLTYKRIDKVKEGDKVLGKNKKGSLVSTKVTKTFKRHVSKLIKLKIGGFNVTCTPEHKFYYHPTHFHWLQAKSLKNKSLHWFGFGFKESDEFKRGWLAGVIDGDGCFNIEQGWHRFRINVKDREIVETIINYGASLGFEIRGRNYRKKEGLFGAVITKNNEVKQFKKFLTKSKNTDFCRGYLAGIYDAEGSGPFKVKQAVIYNKNNTIVRTVSDYLKFLGFKFKIYFDKDGVAHIKINNVPEFFIKCRPILSRKRNNIFKTTIKSVKTRLKVLDIKPVNKKTEVCNIETGTHNYIINGLLVHNCDHSDSVSARDQGWIQLYAESSQESLDSIIQAYKISEDKKVLLPTMVCFDGFSLTHVFEPVDEPEQGKVDRFLPHFKPVHKLDPKNPKTFGPIGFPNSFMHFKQQQQEAMLNAIDAIKNTNSAFKKAFGRSYGDGLLDLYKMQDADYAIIGMGTLCGTARVAIDRLRKQGKKAGLIRVRSLRPFPEKGLQNAMKGLQAAAVIDRHISLGQEGPLFSDIRSAIYCNDITVNSYIAGLGGRDITVKHFEKVFKDLEAGKQKGEWLF